MSNIDLAHWQKDLVTRLERGVGRSLNDADLRCVEWNWSAGTYTVCPVCTGRRSITES